MAEEPQVVESSESLIQEEKLTETRRKIYEVTSKTEGFVTVMEFGTPGGNDLDIRLLVEGNPDPDELARLRNELHEVDESIHFFMSKASDFENGNILETDPKSKPIEKYLAEGVELDQVDVKLPDYGLLALYVASTAREIDSDGNTKKSESAQKAIDNIELTAESGSSFAMLYTSTFLHEYFGSDKVDKSSIAKRAKLHTRITLGRVMSQIPENELDGSKRSLVSHLQSEDQTKSMDERIADFLLEKHSNMMSEDTRKLVEKAGKVRSRKEDGDIEFFNTATHDIFYQAYQVGAEHRDYAETAFNALTSYALSQVFEPIVGQNGVEKVSVDRGEQLIDKDSEDDSLYIVPFKRSDGTVNSGLTVAPAKENQMVHIIPPGSVVGEVKALLRDVERTASVSPNSNLEAIKVPGELIRNLFANKDVLEELSMRVIQTNEAKAVDIFLRLQAVEMSRTLANIMHDTSPPHNKETHDSLKKHNPLVDFYHPDEVGEAFKTLEQNFRTREVDNPPVKIVKYKKGETIYERNEDSKNKMHFSIEGEVDIVGVLAAGGNLTLEEKSVIGESAIAGYKERSASVIAKTDCTLYEIDVDWLKRYANKRGNVANSGGKVINSSAFLYHIAAVSVGRIKNRLEE